MVIGYIGGMIMTDGELYHTGCVPKVTPASSNSPSSTEPRQTPIDSKESMRKVPINLPKQEKAQSGELAY